MNNWILLRQQQINKIYRKLVEKKCQQRQSALNDNDYNNNNWQHSIHSSQFKNLDDLFSLVQLMYAV